jgi:hypothetical protein
MTEDSGLEEKMRTIVIEKTEEAQCQKFARVHGHSVAAYSSAVVDCFDFLNSEWEISYSRSNSAKDSIEMFQTAPINANAFICEEQEFEVSKEFVVSETLRNELVDEAKRNIRILSLFTAEPLTSMLPYETIEHFRRLIAGFKLTLGYLENA